MTFQSITGNFLPSSGLIDVHVHVRDPDTTHKEDWTSCSSSALTGGVTTIFAMPNASPAVVDRAAFDLAMKVSMCGTATRMNTLNKGFSPFAKTRGSHPLGGRARKRITNKKIK